MAVRRAIALLIAGGAVLAVLGAAAPPRAWANGAFPMSLQILVPAGRPGELALATNFGLILSEDGGATWEWTCEQPETFGASGYAMGPAPLNRTFALSLSMGTLAHSDDGSCTWTSATGDIAGAVASDYFPDPGDPQRVLAIATSQSLARLFESSDGGAAFSTMLYTAPPGGQLQGVEIARSDPRTIYLALDTPTQTAGPDGAIDYQDHPKLLRSGDGGASFTTVDLEPMLGHAQVRIMAVDPADAGTIYLRVVDVGQGQERAAISHDGGDTLTTPVTVPGVLTGFARLASGTILVAATAATAAVGFRSGDGGATFQPWTGLPHVEALAERDGKLYVAAKNYTDGWALGVSTDEGLNITPIISYDQVGAVKACVRGLPVCMDSCEMVASRFIWPAAVCDDAVTPPPGPKPASGCSCASAGVGGATRAGVAALALSLVAAGLLAARARRRRH